MSKRQIFFEINGFRDAILEAYGEELWTTVDAVTKGITIREDDAEQLDERLQVLCGATFGKYMLEHHKDQYRFIEHNEGFPRIRVEPEESTEESTEDKKDDPEGRLLKVIFGDPEEQQRVGKLLMDLASSCSLSLEYKPELNEGFEWYVAKVGFDYTDYDDNEVSIPLYGTGDTIVKALEDLKVAYDLAFKVFEHQTP